MARFWSRRSGPGSAPPSLPAESLSTVLIKAMSSFGCAFRLVFVLGTLIVLCSGCIVLILLTMKWVGLTAVAADAGAGAIVVAGTGLAGPPLAALLLLVRRGRR